MNVIPGNTKYITELLYNIDIKCVYLRICYIAVIFAILFTHYYFRLDVRRKK